VSQWLSISRSSLTQYCSIAVYLLSGWAQTHKQTQSVRLLRDRGASLFVQICQPNIKSSTPVTSRLSYPAVFVFLYISGIAQSRSLPFSFLLPIKWQFNPSDQYTTLSSRQAQSTDAPCCPAKPFQRHGAAVHQRNTRARVKAPPSRPGLAATRQGRGRTGLQVLGRR
jgi:hypothetical protein